MDLDVFRHHGLPTYITLLYSFTQRDGLFWICTAVCCVFLPNPKFAGRLESTPGLGGMLKNTCQFVFNISPLLSIFVEEEAASTFLSHYSGCVSNRPF